ncbi:hypothetical protein KP509_04G003000 [Ceratopteris richardii]|uniref:Uncharacterized protein n=1 Tax=Ceratopteris richardii TaxID=49495 RepID=A0A8T2V1Q2_CERRI|nr:hypothetical protein KP509_04G003000 [Ceratopteris richardii]
MGRAPCCDKVGLKRGPWTPEEDRKLIAYINENGHGSWRALPKKAGLLRCGKSCRLRWTNYLRPDIKRGEFSSSEEESIIKLHALLGNRWSAIASHLPKRTDNEIKNYWNTHLRKKMLKMGLDPTTHKPMVDSTAMDNNAELKVTASTGESGLKAKDRNSVNPNVTDISNVPKGNSIAKHMAQWESARLEAEARLTREAQLRAKGMWSANAAALSPIVSPKSNFPPNSFNLMRKLCGSSIMSSNINAIHLVQSQHRWGKPSEGQAILMRAEPTWHSGIRRTSREVLADSSSCSSPCSDANTINNNSSSITAGTDGMDNSSPTSTLCSLDSFNRSGKGLRSSFGPDMGIRKLSWDDALVEPPLVKFEVDMRFRLPQEGSCKQEESSTFSSLMQEAMANVDMITSSFAFPEEEREYSMLTHGSAHDQMEDNTIFGCDFLACEKPFLIPTEEQAMAEGNGGPAGKQLNASHEIKNTECASHCTMNEETSYKCLIESRGEKFSFICLPGAVDHVEEIVPGTNHCKDKRSDQNQHDCEGKNIEISACIKRQQTNAEMSKELPKLKAETSKSEYQSFCNPNNNEISDYWGSIMEPCLPPADVTF